MKKIEFKASKVKLSSEDLYKRIENQAWNWYNKEIAYNYTRVGSVELVLLKGNYEGKFAIKIPAKMDILEYREYLCDLYNISIRKRIFDTAFDSVGNQTELHTYLFMYQEPQV